MRLDPRLWHAAQFDLSLRAELARSSGDGVRAKYLSKLAERAFHRVEASIRLSRQLGDRLRGIA